MGLSKTIIAEHAVVASEQPLASMAGYDVLRKGGNAFDAAVATSFAFAVTFHPAGGLGGDFFGMFYEAKSGKVHCLNGSGWSPSGLTLDLVKSKGEEMPTFGPLSCMVPGCVRGVWEMHKKLGGLEFGDLVSQAEEYATRGFPAGAGICRSIAGAYPGLSEEARRVFASKGAPPSPGDCIRQESLGNVIADIRDGGPDAFYSGRAAENIRSTLEGLGVPTKLDDFKEFRPEWVTPLTLDYRRATVYEVPPNSMGATSLLILKLLLEEDLSHSGPLSRERIELTMRAALKAYSRRDEMLGDPRFGDFDLEEFMSAPSKVETPTGRIRPGDTTAFSVADSEGNMVSGIQSLFFHFGSRVFVPDCGIMLNNRELALACPGPTSSNLERDRSTPFPRCSSSATGDHNLLSEQVEVTSAPFSMLCSSRTPSTTACRSNKRSDTRGSCGEAARLC